MSTRMSILVYSEFVAMLQARLASRGAEVQNRELVVESAGSKVTVSLDRLYRQYVEAVLQNPAATHEEVLGQVEQAVENHSKGLFELKELPRVTPVGLRQNCVVYITPG